MNKQTSFLSLPLCVALATLFCLPNSHAAQAPDQAGMHATHQEVYESKASTPLPTYYDTATEDCVRSTLIYAANRGDLARATALLEKGANANDRDKEGNTSLIKAAQNGHAAVVQLLITNHAAIEAKNTWGKTALMWAAINGQAAVVQVLLDHQANIEAQDIDGDTALMFAALGGHTAVVQVLLDHHAAIEAQDEEGDKKDVCLFMIIFGE